MNIVRFKLIKNIYNRYNSDLRNCSTVNEVLINYFGLEKKAANYFIKRYHLDEKDVTSVVKVIEYCKELNFNNDDVLSNPKLLRANAITLEQQYLALIEGGFYDITPKILSKFRMLAKSSIGDLKNAELIRKETDIARSLVSYTNPPFENFDLEYTEDEIWADVHFKIQYQYLKQRLETTDDALNKLFKTFRGIKTKSFQVICELINMAVDMGYTYQKILNCGYLLSTPPKYTKTTLKKFPTLCGVDMKHAMWSYPKLFCTSTENIEKIYKILKDHNISEEAIQRGFNVFHMSPESVEFRLKELERISDFKIFLNNPGILRLVVHQHRAKSRLQFLKKIQLRCTGVSVLGREKSTFNSLIREGRDQNVRNDLYTYLHGKLNVDPKEFNDLFKRHKFYLQVPILSIEDTINYLKRRKFKTESILEVIWIILYPKAYIEAALEEIDRHFEDERRKKLTQKKILNLAIFFMERDHNFTGNGIWYKTEESSEKRSES